MNINVLGQISDVLMSNLINSIQDKGSDSLVYEAASKGSLLFITSKYIEDVVNEQNESVKVKKLEELAQHEKKATLIITPSQKNYKTKYNMTYQITSCISNNLLYIKEDNVYVDFDYSNTHNQNYPLRKISINSVFTFDPTDSSITKTLAKPVEVTSILGALTKNTNIIVTSSEINEQTRNIYALLF